MPFAHAIDADIHYEDTGGNGPIVLLAHEFFMDHTMFAAQKAALAPEFRIVTWDARGHGRTRDRGLPFTYWTAARDALTVLDHLGAERAVVGGSAQGGFTALRTALLAPERVSALILISTEAHGCVPQQWTHTRRFLDEWYDDNTRAQAVERLAEWLIGDDDRHRHTWSQRWLDHDSTGIEMAAGCLLDRESVTERLTEIACPALVVHATASGIARERAEHLAREIPGSMYLEIDGGRPGVTITHPEPVNQAIRGFLRARRISPRGLSSLRGARGALRGHAPLPPAGPSLPPLG
ncbi:alpha/beta fold hydrolase [Nocardia donostiensis]|uniref:alpha/beta fold hydrolase n=1 Tax=Nocardia donostiensis TaxID=1538463 RepID=UPI0009DB5F30|nr:alpha/beta fold hydrolase [Nocardia donostiensis]